MQLVENERLWTILGITSAVLGFILGLFGIILTQVLPRSVSAQTAGVVLVVIASGFVVMVMVYTCFALKNNYKLFALFSLGEPELRTDLKRRVLATNDPMPENLTALAAVASVTSQGNTLHNVPPSMTTQGNVLHNAPMELTTVSATGRAQMQAAAQDEAPEDEERPPMDARSDDSLVTQEPLQSNGTLTAVSDSWRKGVSFMTPSTTPASSVMVDEMGPMPVYETIDRTAAEARSLSLLNADDVDVISAMATEAEVESLHDDGGLLPAHYVGTYDDRIEERLPERPPTPSDGSGSIQEAIYDAADGPQEPDLSDDVQMASRDVIAAARASTGTSSLLGTDVNLDGVAQTDAAERLVQMRGRNALRRKEISEDFNTYQNATGKRNRFLKKGGLRASAGYDATSDAGSQFDNVSEIGEVDVPQERLSVAPSDLSYPETEPSHVDSNLMF